MTTALTSTALSPTASDARSYGTRRARSRSTAFAISRPTLARTLTLGIGVAAVATALTLGLSGPAISPVDPAVLGPAPGSLTTQGVGIDPPDGAADSPNTGGAAHGGHGGGGRGDR